MKQHGSVSALQLGGLTFVFVFSTTIAFLLSPLAGAVSFDGPLCIFIAAIVGTGFTTLGMRYVMKRQESFLGAYGSAILPKYVHKAILLMVSFFFLHLAAYILREFTDFFVPTYLKGTPNVAVAILVMAAVASLAQSGVSAIFRFAQGAFVIIGLLFFFKPLFFVSSLASPMWYEFLRVHDWKAVWVQTYSLIPWYGELLMFAYITPVFNSNQHNRRIIWIGSLAGTYVLIVEFLLMIFFFGPKLSAAMIYPALELTGFIHLGDFLHNIDALIVSIWFTGYFIKLSIVFTLGTLVFSQMLSLPSYKPITFTLAAVVVSMSLILAKNPVELSTTFTSSWSTFALFTESLLFIYPLVAWFKRKRNREPSVSSNP